MKHLFILVAFVFLLFTQGKSQIKISVIDSSSRQHLSSATIYQFSSRFLFLSKEKGETELKFFGPDTVRISYAGYIDKVIRVERGGFFEVALVRNVRILPEVVVRQCTHWSKEVIYKPEEDTGSFGGVSWGNSGDKALVAMFLPSQHVKSKLLSISLDIRIGWMGTKEAAKAPIRFSFYSVDTSTMLPSDFLTLKTIFFYPKKVGRQSINLDSLGLMIPEQGMYIALESYQDDAYSYLIPLIMPNGNVDTVKWYGGSLDGIYARGSWLSIYNFRTGQWAFGGGKPLDKTRRHGIIRYEIKYAICNESEN